MKRVRLNLESVVNWREIYTKKRCLPYIFMQNCTFLIVEPPEIEQLYPFNLMHPAWELRCGALRLFEKIQRRFPEAPFIFWSTDSRKPHVQSFLARFDGFAPHQLSNAVCVLRGNILPTPELLGQLQTFAKHYRHAGQPSVLLAKTKPVAAFIPAGCLQDAGMPDWAAIADFSDMFYTDAQQHEIQVTVFTYLWDVLQANNQALNDDAGILRPSYSGVPEFLGVYYLNESQIFFGHDVRIAPCTVIDATRGPVMIGNGVEIMANSTIIGPCSIGDFCLIKAGTRIYENTTLGEGSKVAGEIKGTIFQGFGNKQHDGCLGYSFMSEWVNLGAGTNVSDLKNNYGVIRARFSPEKSAEIDTGRTSLGLLCGDHSKSGINTMFNTGTVVGLSANVFDAGYPDKFIPSFSWGGREDSPAFELEKALGLARTVIRRRNRTLLPEEEVLFRLEYEKNFHHYDERG